MDALAMMGLTFGITGFVFGLTGFIFGTIAINKVKELGKSIDDL